MSTSTVRQAEHMTSLYSPPTFHPQPVGAGLVSAEPPNVLPSLPTESTPTKPPKKPDLDVYPDSFYSDSIPIFKPTFEDFVDFNRYVRALEKWGKLYGIVKIVPPEEWLDQLPKSYNATLDKVVVKSPIHQQFIGGGGVYRQTNVESTRTYSVKQWWRKCTSTKHLPPYLQKKRTANGYGISGTSRPTRSNQVASSKLDEANAARRRSEAAASATPWKRLVQKSNLTPNGAAPDSMKAQTQSPLSPQQSYPSPTPLGVESVEAGKNSIASTPTTPSKACPDEASKLTPMASDLKLGTPTSEDTMKSTSEESYLSKANFHDVDFIDQYGSITFAEEYYRQLEQTYWMYLSYDEPMYGADMSGTLTGPTVPVTWNMNGLKDLLCKIGHTVPGVNTPYLYFGMWKATFAWHVEDLDLFSINFLHFGAPKQWYAISPKDADKFERLAKGLFSTAFRSCPQFLRHKTVVIDPSYIEKHGIKVHRMVQQKHEFVITFPKGYHAGYNLGFNCAESVNFALESWAEMGKKAAHCKCVHDSVRIDPVIIEKVMDKVNDPNYRSEDDEDLKQFARKLHGRPRTSTDDSQETKPKKKRRMAPIGNHKDPSTKGPSNGSAIKLKFHVQTPNGQAGLPLPYYPLFPYGPFPAFQPGRGNPPPPPNMSKLPPIPLPPMGMPPPGFPFPPPLMWNFTSVQGPNQLPNGFQNPISAPGLGPSVDVPPFVTEKKRKRKKTTDGKEGDVSKKVKTSNRDDQDLSAKSPTHLADDSRQNVSSEQKGASKEPTAERAPEGISGKNSEQHDDSLATDAPKASADQTNEGQQQDSAEATKDQSITEPKADDVHNATSLTRSIDSTALVDTGGGVTNTGHDPSSVDIPGLGSSD